VIYRLLYKLVFERIDPETAHRLVGGLMRAGLAIPGVRAAVSRLLRPREGVLETSAFGLTFPSPLGVAAGMDKDGRWYPNLLALGFGFVEVGTVTSLPQPGNGPPRVFRLPRSRGLLNRMGFPNPGAEVVASRTRGHKGIVGANIGKTKALPAESIVEDYRACARALAPSCDYMVINVSSPNTPGLVAMQEAARLRELILGVQAELAAAPGASLPLLVKIGPDLSDEQIDEIARLSLDLGIAGIVATNTTTDVSLVGEDLDLASLTDSTGGISGRPLAQRARVVLRRLREVVGDDLVLISVGGIDSAEEAWERIVAGATLVQAYSGFIYGGPLWAHRVNRGLERRARQAGAVRLQDLVGTGATGNS
jgi:dihydroorotate dehydrogenase